MDFFCNGKILFKWVLLLSHFSTLSTQLKVGSHHMRCDDDLIVSSVQLMFLLLISLRFYSQ